MTEEEYRLEILQREEYEEGLAYEEYRQECGYIESQVDDLVDEVQLNINHRQGDKYEPI